MKLSKVNKSKLTKVACASGMILFSAAAVQAQSPIFVPVSITEASATQPLPTTPNSMLLNNPLNSGAATPSLFGFSEASGSQPDMQSFLGGLNLGGSAYFTTPSGSSTPSKQVKQAVNQTLSYQKGGFSLNAGYLNVDKAFSVDQSLLASSTASQTASLKDMLSKAGQSGLNTGLNFNGSGNKFGMQFSSIADALHNQQKTTDVISLERDFSKAFSLGYTTTGTVTQPNGGSSSGQTTDVLHLAYSPTRSGFLFDGTSTRSLSDQGGTNDDLLLKVAQQFHAFNFSSQIESSQTASANTSSSGWRSERYILSGPVGQGVTFTSTLNKKSMEGAPGIDDFDTTIKAAETRYVELAAEYSKNDDTPGNSMTKQSMLAKINPGINGPLGMLSYTLAISNQQVQLLGGMQSASIGVDGTIRPISCFDFVSGAKFYLTYASVATSAVESKRENHSARTLRIVRAPSGKNALSWTVSQQQRLDQNGQQLRTSSDYEVKYALNHRVNVGLAETNDSRTDGTYVDEDQRVINVAWNKTSSEQFLAQYAHKTSLSEDIADEESYSLDFCGPILHSKKVDLGLGESRKVDPTGATAFGTTANVTYAWTPGGSDLLNISSKLTDWQNHGFNGTTTPSVEEDGQVNFQKEF